MGTNTTTRNFITRKEKTDDAKINSLAAENNKLHLMVQKLELRIRDLELAQKEKLEDNAK
jgi:hypothetical protein